jgi:hypothetical protein
MTVQQPLTLDDFNINLLELVVTVHALQLIVFLHDQNAKYSLLPDLIEPHGISRQHEILAFDR